MIRCAKCGEDHHLAWQCRYAPETAARKLAAVRGETMVRELPATLTPHRNTRKKTHIAPAIPPILAPVPSRSGADAEDGDNQPSAPDKPAFDRAAYQKAYMKAYMRKKRAADKAVKT